jgi:hypothetical protein
MHTMTEVRERPILFSGEMVRAILAGAKTQTRRVVKPQPHAETIRALRSHDRWWYFDRIEEGEFGEVVQQDATRCPYGQPGGHLWVREAWACPKQLGGSYQREKLLHREAFERENGDWRGWRGNLRWKPSIHMPRWASRITLEITYVRVERVQEISEEDAIAEGVSVLSLQSAEDPSAWWQTAPGVNQSRTPQGAFSKLWDQINGARGYGWDANPWVWVVSFRRINP